MGEDIMGEAIMGDRAKWSIEPTMQQDGVGCRGILQEPVNKGLNIAFGLYRLFGKRNLKLHPDLNDSTSSFGEPARSKQEDNIKG